LLHDEENIIRIDCGYYLFRRSTEEYGKLIGMIAKNNEWKGKTKKDLDDSIIIFLKQYDKNDRLYKKTIFETFTSNNCDFIKIVQNLNFSGEIQTLLLNIQISLGQKSIVDFKQSSNSLQENLFIMIAVILS
jgi:hypothetical protein